MSNIIYILLSVTVSNPPTPFCRAIVEVADFNFGDAGSDMDYKSFRQRLVESMNEMRQNRNGVPTDLTGDSTVGYGSMK